LRSSEARHQERRSLRHLVLGGAGFIGANLAARLASDAEQVTVLDNMQRRGARENVAWLSDHNAGIAVIQQDIREGAEGLEPVVADADATYHLAAQVAVTTSISDPQTDFELNAVGTFNVLEAMRRVGSEAMLIFASTNKVYGNLNGLPTTESDTRYVFGGH